ncbi:uncharacterized protein LOC115227230 isoform X2 [Octopus sinensis]|uniref:Uncharacterized protein LOC115227230 isoform X2 n=1 Tax=Octopus sinensis TaxID=2607531 RepID=A0A7E6ELT0_9MOLL|nr:uncharacterized protein LOC115227230 isoform X2 [Octopus sinensis]
MSSLSGSSSIEIPLDASLENQVQEFRAALRSFEEDLENEEVDHSQAMSHSKHCISEPDAYGNYSQDNSGNDTTVKGLTHPQEPQQKMSSVIAAKQVEMANLSDSSDLQPGSEQIFDDISTGSYRKLPLTSDSQQLSERPVYGFPKPKTQALMTALRSFEKQMKNLESELNLAMSRNKQLLSEADTYKNCPKNKAGKETFESLAPQQSKPEGKRTSVTATKQKADQVQIFSPPSCCDVRPHSDQIFDISTGSYKKLPTTKPSINDDHQTSDKPVYTFSETNIEALMNGLKSYKQHVDILESGPSQAVTHTTQCASTETDDHKNHSQRSSRNETTAERWTHPQDVIASIARIKSRCVLLKKNLEQLRQLALKAEQNKVNLQKELENQKSSKTLTLHQSSTHQLSLDQITGLEREILQLSIIQNVAEQRIKLLEQALAIEKKQMERLETALKSLTHQDGADVNMQDVFTLTKPHSKCQHLDSSANKRLITGTASTDCASSSLLNCNNLQDLFAQLQREFCQLTWKHQNLTKLYNETCESQLHKDLETEIDNLVDLMETKAKQMVKIRKVLYPPKKETKHEKRKKRETNQSLCKTKTASLGNHSRTSKRACRNLPQTGSENVARKPHQISKDTRKLQATLRQEDLRWV